MEDIPYFETPYYSREEFGQRLEELITSRGGSRKTLSESTGISLPQICRIIKTGKEVTLKNLDKICRTLNTAPNYLMYGIEPTSLYGIHTTKLMATYNQDCFISVVDTTENI